MKKIIASISRLFSSKPKAGCCCCCGHDATTSTGSGQGKAQPSQAAQSGK